MQIRVHDKEHQNHAIKKRATHIQTHLNEKKLKDEEADLQRYNTEAYHPIGCYIKIGG